MVLGLLVFGLADIQAQTYNINSSGTGNCGSNPGIDANFICAVDGATATLGVFTDTNTPGFVLTSMNLVIYGACAGDVAFSLNGTPIVSGTAPVGLTCTCQSIASDPDIPQNYSVTVTPAIQAAFVVGGNNTLSVTGSNSAVGTQCFYGADVTLNATPGGGGATDVPTLSEWGLIVLALLFMTFGTLYILQGQRRFEKE